MSTQDDEAELQALAMANGLACACGGHKSAVTSGSFSENHGPPRMRSMTSM